MLKTRLENILAQRELTALFQPIIDLQNAKIHGYEALIRAPSDSALHSPLTLFKVARANGLIVQTERLCREVAVERFAKLMLPGKIFVNVSPDVLMGPDAAPEEALKVLARLGLSPDRVVIELTENQPALNYEVLRTAVEYYRRLGFQIAIDDLGEGFSSLRLWSEIRPDYVKIDMHFIQGIHLDPIKQQFVRSIQKMAETSSAAVIAEGVETNAELAMIRELGLVFAQGYLFARPASNPAAAVAAEMSKTLSNAYKTTLPLNSPRRALHTAEKLTRVVTTVTPVASNNDVYEMFFNDPELQVLPVIDQGSPVGLITRAHLLDQFARPYLRELHGKKSCALFMDASPLITDKDTSLQDLSKAIVHGARRHLFNGYIVTDRGQYLGMGTGHDLMGEITQMQIAAASLANPLTRLPGNALINEQIDALLRAGNPFFACYADLDHFKPFNDVYGYREGDDVIQMTGRVLSAGCIADRDFIGHIGGDDFLLLYAHDEMRQRCADILGKFDEAILGHFSENDRSRAGYFAEDRQGNKVFHPLISLSLGLIEVLPDSYTTHHQVAAAVTDAKKQAKKIAGSSYFIEPRRPSDMR